MKFSAAGMELLKRSEGFRSRVYLDAAGFPTIGFGHRLVHPESFPRGVNDTQADNILALDVRESEQAVEHLVKVPLTQGQFDALVDFTFNLGSARLGSSTLLRELNLGHYDLAANELLRWDHCGSEELASLQTRRRAERGLWLGGVASRAA